MNHFKSCIALVMLLFWAAVPARAEMDLSANLGIMSDYIYRGFHQSDAVANGGLDLTTGPFYLGTWVADLDSGSGMEIDVYGGLSWEFDNGMSAYVGYTAYRYTEDDSGSEEAVSMEYVNDNGVLTTGTVYSHTDGSSLVLTDAEFDARTDKSSLTMVTECVGGGFDSDYDEINLGVAYAKDDFSVSLDYAIGEHENEHACSSEENDYDIATLTLDYKGAFVTFGTYGISEDDTAAGEPEGDYFEIGYATTISDLDFSIYVVDSDEDIDDETRLVLTIGYGFGL